MKKILLVLLFAFSAFAAENEERGVPYIKKDAAQLDSAVLAPEIIRSSKIKIKDNTADVLLLMSPKKVWLENKTGYISNITAVVDNRKVFDVSLSHYLYAEASKIKFKFRELSPDSNEIIYTLIDNNGRSIQKSFPIRSKTLSVDEKTPEKDIFLKSIKVNPNAWEETSIDGAIKALYGSNNIKKTDQKQYLNKGMFFDRCAPDKCLHDVRFPIHIRVESKKELDSIGIFSTATPTALLAVFKIPEDGIAYVEASFKVEKNGELFVVAKGRDGMVYRSGSYTINTDIYGEMDFSTLLGFDFGG